jgi:hypothetical protein
VADQLEHDAIRMAALDYIEGWYSGDPGRMRQSLHPQLAKRIQRQGREGRLAVENLDAKPSSSSPPRAPAGPTLASAQTRPSWTSSGVRRACG